MVYHKNYDDSVICYYRYYAVVPIKISKQWVWLDYYWAVTFSSKDFTDRYGMEYYLTNSECLIKVLTGELICSDTFV